MLRSPDNEISPVISMGTSLVLGSLGANQCLWDEPGAWVLEAGPVLAQFGSLVSWKPA